MIEPRTELGQGVAYSTRDPWHRLNVPVVAMSALADDPDHFRRDGPARHQRRSPVAWTTAATWARCSPSRTPDPRQRCATWWMPPSGSTRRGRASASRSPQVRRSPRHAVAPATGVETPVQPPYLQPLAEHDGVVADPWVVGALDAIRDGEIVAIIGSSLTAIDLAGSILNRHPRTTVVAVSRHGHLPRPHEDPWRPRLPEPAFTIEAFHAFRRPAGRGVGQAPVVRRGLAPRRRLAPAHLAGPLDVDGGRPQAHVPRRLPATTGRSIGIGSPRRSRATSTDGSRRGRPCTARRSGRSRATGIASGSSPAGERSPRPPPGTWTGSSSRSDRTWTRLRTRCSARRSPTAWCARGHSGSPSTSTPATGLVVDEGGGTPLPVYAMGALRKGVLWETLAVPEIREQAATVAARLVEAAG